MSNRESYLGLASYELQKAEEHIQNARRYYAHTGDGEMDTISDRRLKRASNAIKDQTEIWTRWLALEAEKESHA